MEKYWIINLVKYDRDSRMFARKLDRYLLWAAEALLLAGTAVAAVRLAGPTEWHPAPLVALLLVLALIGQVFSVEIRSGQLSASPIAIVLAMGLLGPAPAAACGLAAMALKSSLRRLAFGPWLNNLATFTVIPFAGGLLVRELVANAHDAQSQGLANSVTFGLVLFAAAQQLKIVDDRGIITLDSLRGLIGQQ